MKKKKKEERKTIRNGHVTIASIWSPQASLKREMPKKEISVSQLKKTTKQIHAETSKWETTYDTRHKGGTNILPKKEHLFSCNGSFFG